MTASRGIYVKRGTRIAWVAENEGKHFCLCGCGEVIPIKPVHFNIGIPQYRHGHNPRPPTKRVRQSAGYIMLWRPRHPFGSPYVLEHRMVMEDHLRRTDPQSDLLVEIDGEMYLRTAVEVHHVNGVKDDNRLENLECMTKSEHARLHNLSRSS